MKHVVAAFFAVLAALSLATAAAAQAGYRIQPGDVLGIEVLQDTSLNREVLVLPDGSISFPFAGTLRVAGLTTGQVQSEITRGIASNFAVEPNVFVNVRQLDEPEPILGGVLPEEPTIDVYYLGEWAAPGVQQVPPGTTLIQALSLGGGFTNFAATNRIQLRRVHPHTGQTSVVTLNYRAVERGGIVSHDPVLSNGDVILAPERRLFE